MVIHNKIGFGLKLTLVLVNVSLLIAIYSLFYATYLNIFLICFK